MGVDWGSYRNWRGELDTGRQARVLAALSEGPKTRLLQPFGARDRSHSFVPRHPAVRCCRAIPHCSRTATTVRGRATTMPSTGERPPTSHLSYCRCDAGGGHEFFEAWPEGMQMSTGRSARQLGCTRRCLLVVLRPMSSCLCRSAHGTGPSVMWLLRRSSWPLLSAVEVEAALRLVVEPKCISKIAVVTILSIHVIATHRMRRNDASSHATCHRRPQQHNQSPILPPF